MSNKDSKTLTGTLEFTASANPLGKIGISRTWADERARCNETVQNKSAITQKKLNNVVSWAFDVDDKKEQVDGTEMLGEHLPFVDFKFTDVFEDPSQGVDFVVASYWSIAPAPGSEKRRTWRQRIWSIFSKHDGSTPAPSYTNLCKVVSMKTTPSHLPVYSRYHAELYASSEGPSPLVYNAVVTKQTDNSVEVTPHVIRGMHPILLTCRLESNEMNICRWRRTSQATTPNVQRTFEDSRKSPEKFVYRYLVISFNVVVDLGTVQS